MIPTSSRSTVWHLPDGTTMMEYGLGGGLVHEGEMLNKKKMVDQLDVPVRASSEQGRAKQ